jgi:hypothetical protein
MHGRQHLGARPVILAMNECGGSGGHGRLGREVMGRRGKNKRLKIILYGPIFRFRLCRRFHKTANQFFSASSMRF